MSFNSFLDPNRAICERIFKYYGYYNEDRPHSYTCSLCSETVRTPEKDDWQLMLAHLRDAKCTQFREAVLALKTADSSGIELCPLNVTVNAFKERSTQLEFHLRMALTELERLGSPLAMDASMRQLSQPRSSVMMATVSTSTMISKTAWSGVV